MIDKDTKKKGTFVLMLGTPSATSATPQTLTTPPKISKAGVDQMQEAIGMAPKKDQEKVEEEQSKVDHDVIPKNLLTEFDAAIQE